MTVGEGHGTRGCGWADDLGLARAHRRREAHVHGGGVRHLEGRRRTTEKGGQGEVVEVQGGAITTQHVCAAVVTVSLQELSHDPRLVDSAVAGHVLPGHEAIDAVEVASVLGHGALATVKGVGFKVADDVDLNLSTNLVRALRRNPSRLPVERVVVSPQAGLAREHVEEA